MAEHAIVSRRDVVAVVDALDAFRMRSVDNLPTVGDEAVWHCKIGGAYPHGALPHGSDLPMRKSVQEAYKQITGVDAGYIFSGWGGYIEEQERAVIENRPPVYERTDWALLKRAADMIEALWAELEAARAASGEGDR